MELGGAERSLIGLLEALCAENHSVDLFLLRHEGELMDSIPKSVNLLPEIPAYTVLARPLKTVLREGHFLLSAARLTARFAAQRYANRHHFVESSVDLEYSHKFTAPLMPLIQKNTEYDLAISFLTPHYFVAQKVHAKKKIAWIHTDYSKVQVDVKSEEAMWNAYDYIASISDGVTESFLQAFPGLKKKIIQIQNILPSGLIRRQAEEKIDDLQIPEGCFCLLSVGRFCNAKNFDNVPEICARILESGVDVRWYLIGFGTDEELIRRKITEFHMEDRVIILGKKENPYPYMAACDLYVQPSRYEGHCVSVKEAQMLQKPVVITNYATAASQMEDGVDGIVVPMNPESCARGISELLKNPERMEQLRRNCSERDYSNGEQILNLCRLF